MSARRLLLMLFGWSVVLAVLAPLGFAAWVSFSPDSFLTQPVWFPCVGDPKSLVLRAKEGSA